ncbi:AraC family transcriptional regulator [Ilyomonas limi]|uniref:AraC family transcriptional regulator n=1 Tax=Ilyomonas limi TaxID=2575867 RepID=A0A4V5UTD5_9BACT|nr:helix-turn-helix domain-containing protein [Ilyomonas limi]TKK64473.1 AraC family transcriptional regulator [Ilyomonas limi]
MNITYQEFKPTPVLQPYVDTYWLLSFEGAYNEYSPGQYCLPNGMVEIVITISEGNYHIGANGDWFPMPDMMMCGVYHKNVIMRATGTTRKFGIRVKPEMLHILFTVPSSVLYEDYTNLENIVGNDAKLFVEQLAEAHDTTKIVSRTDAFLLAQLNKHKQEHSYLIKAVNLMRSSKGSVSVDAISKSVYRSPRQLQRSFQHEMGLSPKSYQRLIRFRNVYRNMQMLQQAGGWAGLSYKLGYADQAHLIRDFKEFTGLVPTDLLLNKSHVFGLAASAKFIATAVISSEKPVRHSPNIVARYCHAESANRLYERQI